MVNEIADVLGKDKQRLDRTEEQLGTTGVTNYFEIPLLNIEVSVENVKVEKVTYSGSEFLILGHPVWGIIGSAALGLGSNSTTTTRLVESAHIFDIDIDFTNTTYENSGSTTSSGWGTGSVVFQRETIIDFSTGSANGVNQSIGSITL